mmetsp:Transcript_49418/g.137299  ORF Transcript_49418/g.137299 Transcript_49418/m.137299 type:complete len:252 (-) Transcript_49418:75-830(-)
MSSLYSAFSAWRCSVASATALSSSLMPVSNAAISAASCSMEPFSSSMAVSESLTDNSNDFFLSSDSSNEASQYSFLPSSPSCSFLRLTTSSSINAMTFSKPAALPFSARAMRSSAGARDLCAAARRIWSARALCDLAVTVTCTKLALAPGKVFLNKSRASSSLRTLMVSASASSSSARVFLTTSHSCVFVAQPSSSSCLNFLSASSACLVSSKSLAVSASSTPSSPTRVILLSICAWSVSTSFFFAAISSS